MTSRTCQHHWMVERPSGTIQKGTCRKCGASRRFSNETTTWKAKSRIAGNRESIKARAEQKAILELAEQEAR